METNDIKIRKNEDTLQNFLFSILNCNTCFLKEQCKDKDNCKGTIYEFLETEWI